MNTPTTVKHSDDIKKNSKSIPIVDGPWPVGSVASFAEDSLAFLDKNVAEHGDIFEVTSSFFSLATDFKRMFFVSHPKFAKHILQEKNRNYRKSIAYDKLKPLVGTGLLTSEGDFWRKQRRLMQPTFHKKRLSIFFNLIVSETKRILEEWDSLPNESTVNLSHDMMKVTLNIICKSMFSADIDDVLDEVNKQFNIASERLIKRAVQPLNMPLWLPTPSNIKEREAYASIRGIVSDIIKKRRQSKTHYDDLLAMLMETEDADTGERMSDTQILDEVVTIFIAGHETTALGLTWAFHCLDENRDAQEKLIKEIDQILVDSDPEFMDLMKLEYTKMVIDETLRLYPPVWIVSRHAIEDDEIDGYTIPKDTNMMIPVSHIHRNETVWNDPLKFIPERFSKEEQKNHIKYAYIPFGGGPRLCIGNNFALMEMQVIIPMILQRFKLEKPSDYKFSEDPLLTLHPKPDMLMRLTKRKK